MSSRRLATIALMLLCAGLVNAADWPQWRGINRDGKSAETGLLKSWPTGGPKLLWSSDKLDTIGVGYGCPAVVGTKLYILGAEGAKKDAKEFCTCLNIKDGSNVWQTPLETQAGNFNDSWGGGPRTTPTVDGDMVYVLGASGDLAALKTTDGSTVWTKNLVKDFGGKIPFWGFSESPLIDGEKLLITPGGGKNPLVALNKKTGDTIWKCSELAVDSAYSSVIVATIAGKKQYVQQFMNDSYAIQKKTGGMTAAFDTTTGKLLWKVEDAGYRIAVIPTPIIDGDKIFVTSGYNAGCKLISVSSDGSELKAEKVYENKIIANHHGGIVKVGDYLYGHSDSANWFCSSFGKGGEPSWKTTKLAGKGSISYADGMLYCYAEGKGTMALVKATPEEYQEVSRFELPKTSPIRSKTQGKVWAHPVISGGKLFLRDYELFYVYDIQGSNQ
jgi:outer membrane protein assembly factor BamB